MQSSSLPFLFILWLIPLIQGQAIPLAPPRNNSCGSCSLPAHDTWEGGWWTTAQPTTTIEAATVVIISNNRTNSTRTTTIWNLPGNYSLPPTNSAGTVVYTKTLTWGSQTTTTVLTYPTGYLSFQTGVTWGGAIPAGSAATATASATGIFNNATQPSCTTVSGTTVSAYPTPLSPLWPTSTTTESYTDTNGSVKTVLPPPYETASFYLWSFVDTDDTTDYSVFCDYPYGIDRDYIDFYPDFAPYLYCQEYALACPAQAVGTAAYLTVTSHSVEDTPATTSSTPNPSKPTTTTPEADNEPTTTPEPASQTTSGSGATGGSSGNSSGSGSSGSGSSGSGSSGTGSSSSSGNEGSSGSSSSGSDGSSGSGETSSGSDGGSSDSGNNGGSSNSGASGSSSSDSNGSSGSGNGGGSPAFQITTNSAGNTVAVAQPTAQPTTIVIGQGQGSTGSSSGSSKGGSSGQSGSTGSGDQGTGSSSASGSGSSSGSGSGSDSGSDDAGASPVAGQPYTYVSGSISTVVTATTNAQGQPVVVLTPSPQVTLAVTTDARGATVVISSIPYTTLPLSDIPESSLPSADRTGAGAGANSAVAATVPFTYVSGSITDVVTPTTDAQGSPVVVLSTATSIPIESVTGSDGMGSYILSGLGGGTATGISTTGVAQVTGNAGSHAKRDIFAVGAIGLAAAVAAF